MIIGETALPNSHFAEEEPRPFAVFLSSQEGKVGFIRPSQEVSQKIINKQANKKNQRSEGMTGAEVVQCCECTDHVGNFPKNNYLIFKLQRKFI